MKKILLILCMIASVSGYAQTVDTISFRIYPDGYTTTFKYPILQGATGLGCRLKEYYPLTTTPQYAAVGRVSTIYGAPSTFDTLLIPVHNTTDTTRAPYELSGFGRQHAYETIECVISH